MSTLQSRKGLVDKSQTVSLRTLWIRNLYDGRHDISRYAATILPLVPVDMAHGQPEERCKCVGTPTSFGT